MENQQQISSKKSGAIKALIIGDSCTDVYHFGTCDRLSPEAPVPVLRTTHSKHQPGMCLNVAANMRGLDMDVDVMTQTNVLIKHRYIDERRMVHLLRMDDEPDPAQVHALDLQWLKSKLIENQYDVIVLSDYDKGLIRFADISAILSLMKTHAPSTPIIVDTKKPDMRQFQGCIMKINENEYTACRGQLPFNADVIVTRGSAGATWRGKTYATDEVKLYDVCGAGDTFLAAFAYNFASTRDIESGIIFANRCASLAVQQFGNFVITRSALEEKA